MKNHKRRLSAKIWGISLIFPFLTVGCAGNEPQTQAPQAIAVELQQLRAATLIDSSEYVGTLEARQRVTVAASRTSGRIVDILVDEGQRVTQGQQLAEIQPQQEQEDVRSRVGDLNAVLSELQAAEAELRQREAERDQATAEIERAKAEVAREEANVADARGQLSLAQVNYERSTFLVKEGARPQQDLDDRNRDLNTAKTQLEARLKARDAAQGSLQASKDNLRAAQKRVEIALANIDSVRGRITSAQGALGAQTQQLEFNFILAPISGIVGNFNSVKEGDVVNQGEQITTITDNQVLLLNINIPIENLDRLRTGLPVEIIKPDGSPGVGGQITFIAPLVDQNAQSVLVKAQFVNDGTLKDEQYVRVRVIWDTKPGVLIPTTAVTSLGSQKFVFVAREGDSKEGQSELIARQIPITVGAIQGQAYQVIDGVKPGERIAVSNILSLKDKLPIKEASVEAQQPVNQL